MQKEHAGENAPTSDRYPVSNYPTSTQPSIFKVEYHHEQPYMNIHDVCSCVGFRAVLFWLFPKTVNLPPKPVGFWLTFIQYHTYFSHKTSQLTWRMPPMNLYLRSHNGYGVMIRIYSFIIFENVTQHKRYT